MYCYKCGIQIKDDSEYCYKCGTKLFVGSNDNRSQSIDNEIVDVNHKTKERSENNAKKEFEEKENVSNYYKLPEHNRNSFKVKLKLLYSNHKIWCYVFASVFLFMIGFFINSVINKTSTSINTTTKAGTSTVNITSISLDKTSETIIKGKSDTLSALITPSDATNQHVVWNSSDPSVIAVNNSGNIIAISEGTAIITVATDDGNYKATCTVTVIPIVNIISITLNKSTDTLKVGYEDTLICSINPTNATNMNITWDSSDKSVVTVDNLGKIKAIGEGKAIITVTTGDGNHKATCKVTVNPKVTNEEKAKKIVQKVVGEGDKVTLMNDTPKKNYYVYSILYSDGTEGDFVYCVAKDTLKLYVWFSDNTFMSYDQFLKLN